METNALSRNILTFQRELEALGELTQNAALQDVLLYKGPREVHAVREALEQCMRGTWNLNDILELVGIIRGTVVAHAGVPHHIQRRLVIAHKAKALLIRYGQIHGAELLYNDGDTVEFDWHGINPIDTLTV